jgi:hypothetical protein
LYKIKNKIKNIKNRINPKTETVNNINGKNKHLSTAKSKINKNGYKNFLQINKKKNK